MTLSIELLPAPLGPMIARTSCSRTSKDTSCSAFTPPNESETLSTERTTSPIFRDACSRCACGADIRIAAMRSCRLLRRRGFEGLCVGNPQIGGDLAGAAVFVAHLRFDVHRPAAVVERPYQAVVFLAGEPPAHLSRARLLAVVGVELFVQDYEAVKLRVGELAILRQVGIHFLDALAHQLVDLVARGKIDI